MMPFFGNGAQCKPRFNAAESGITTYIDRIIYRHILTRPKQYNVYLDKSKIKQHIKTTIILEKVPSEL